MDDLKPARPWIPLCVSILCLTIAQIGITFYLPAFPAYAREIGEPAERVAGTVAVYLLFYGVAQLIAGPLSDVIGRRPVVVAGLGVFSLSALSLLFCRRSASLYVLRGVQGIGGGTLSVLVKLILRDSFPGAALTRALSRLETASSVTPTLAPFMGGLLVTSFGWRGNFVAVALWALSAGAAAVWLHRASPKARVEPRVPWSARSLLGAYVELFRHLEFVLAGAIVLLTYATILVFLSSSPVLLQEKLGLSALMYGRLMILPALSTALSGLVGARLAKRCPGARVIMLGALLLAASGAWLCLSWVSPMTSAGRVIAPFMLTSFAATLIFPCAYSAAFGALPHRSGFVAAMLGCLQLSGASIVALCVGRRAAALPVIGCFYIASALALLGLAAASSIGSRRARAAS